MASDRRQVRAWLAYDWANSAWAMTVAVAVLPVYFAGTVVPKGGVEVLGMRLDATVLWGYVNSASTLAVFLTAPILGAIADRLGARRALLSAFGIAGGLLTALLGLCGAGDVFTTLLIYALSQFAFVSANVFYDSFLPHLAKDEELDRLSARGFAVGYVGGSLHFVLALVLMATHARWGLSAEAAARVALSSAGLWWAGFGAITFLGLEEPEHGGTRPGVLRAVREGVADTLATTRRVAKVKPVLLFLLAFILYNDGVQTVIKMASLYGTEEVGVGMPLMMGTLLGIQLLAMVGALVFARLAGIWGTKRVLLLAVSLWLVAVAWAYVLTTPAGFVGLAALAGLVLGAVQALSRSLFAAMIPREASAELFGFFSVFNKLAGILGTFLFATVRQATGTSRPAILSVAVLFVAGLVLLWRVDEKEAKRRREELR
ncbi:MAG: MFS transporter [Holophagales bacterium]|nr:MFS transporter [Holophagales bacterium]